MYSKVYIVSDSTGDTAEKVFKAALKQFESAEVEMEIHALVRTEENIEEIIERAAQDEALVLHTMVSTEQRATLQHLCSEADIDELDLIGPLLGKLATVLQTEAKAMPGGLHPVNDEYFRRIEAVEFAVKNDDGQHPRNLRRRTSSWLAFRERARPP